MSPFPKLHISRDSFFHETTPLPTSSSPSSWPVTIYFISGNPGLISYYHSFLSLLGERLSKHSARTFHIFGHSLAGFELDRTGYCGTPSPPSTPTTPDTVRKSSESRYYDLEDQICFVRGKLNAHMRGLRYQYEREHVPDEPRPRVILVGHSVGSYIAMEILRRHREDNNILLSVPGPVTVPDTSTTGSDMVDFDIVGGVMLFPTVVDIAKSPSGQKLTFLLRFIPQLALVVSLFARVLTTILPTFALRGLIRLVMGSPPAEAVDATCSFLKSRCGVREALYMAADEMRTITSDKWSDDVWGVSLAREPMTRLFFYFGRNDHWVAERTREEILEFRGRTRTGPRMVVCEDSLPHAFCLRHSDLMSVKVADMVASIVGDR